MLNKPIHQQFELFDLFWWLKVVGDKYKQKIGLFLVKLNWLKLMRLIWFLSDFTSLIFRSFTQLRFSLFFFIVLRKGVSPTGQDQQTWAHGLIAQGQRMSWDSIVRATQTPCQTSWKVTNCCVSSCVDTVIVCVWVSSLVHFKLAPTSFWRWSDSAGCHVEM